MSIGFSNPGALGPNNGRRGLCGFWGFRNSLQSDFHPSNLMVNGSPSYSTPFLLNGCSISDANQYGFDPNVLGQFTTLFSWFSSQASDWHGSEDIASKRGTGNLGWNMTYERYEFEETMYARVDLFGNGGAGSYIGGITDHFTGPTFFAARHDGTNLILTVGSTHQNMGAIAVSNNDGSFSVNGPCANLHCFNRYLSDAELV